jgi:hypothetical protein
VNRVVKRGCEAVCRLYSLVLSCKPCGADPEAYVESVPMGTVTTPAAVIASFMLWTRRVARPQR